MKIEDVHYQQINMGDLIEITSEIERYMKLSSEFGCEREGLEIFSDFEKMVNEIRDRFDQLVIAQTDAQEPDLLEDIRALRPAGPRRLEGKIPEDFRERLRGAFYGRMAGCTLGAALEFVPMDAAEYWAKHFGDDFPLTDYWSQVRNPEANHYITGKMIDLTKGNMDAVPPDDDTIYTLLGLLTLEKYGPDFTHEDMAQIWQQYLPIGDDMDFGMRGCFWGERSMMKNLKAGLPVEKAGLVHNPNLQNIAAWTRADAYGYACPGWPEKAAELAYKDSMINHRRNGVYGSMFMAATIAAAFAVDDPLEAVKIGLTEIPENCLFAEAIRFALDNPVKNYREGHDRTWARYQGMFVGSAATNAIHVVTGLQIGEKNFTRTIGETVAMSGDNDCTGATAGSILGAVIGYDAIEKQWVEPFRGKMRIYLNEMPELLDMEEVVDRFKAVAEKICR